MKKISKLFLVAAVAFGVMACNKEEAPNVVQGPEATVSVKVVPSGLSSTTRLAGDLSGNGTSVTGLAAESAIKNVEVWLFAGNQPNGYKKGGNNALTVEGIETSSGSKTLIVAANANIGEVAKKEDLLNKLANLSQDITTTGLIMTAEPVEIDIVKGKNQYGYLAAEATSDANQISPNTRLALTRINARIAVVSVEYNFNAEAPYDAFELTEVAMFNARSQSKLFGTPLVKDDATFAFGAKYPSPSNSYVGADDPSASATTELLQAFQAKDQLKLPKLIVSENAHYFYALENDPTKGTFIVLKGNLKKNGEVVVAPGLYTDAEGYTYYPIWVNAVDSKYTYSPSYSPDGTIKRNTQYNISVTIKKAGNPTIDEKEVAQLDVYVEVAPWTVVEQTVVWE